MKMKRTRWLGLALCTALAASSGLLSLPAAQGLPSGAPKTGIVCAPGIVSGAVHHFDLVAGSGYTQTPDGNQIFMWSYADANDAKVSLRTFQYPGPVLCVTQGETVEVHLSNNLPDPTSIVFPGQDTEVSATGGVAGLLTTEAAAGGQVTYTFEAGSPGTYLYESGSDIEKQIEMGLYGALVVRPASNANWAYDDSSTQFDPNREYLLLLAEIDPDLHHLIEIGDATDYDFTNKHNRYFTVNGREFPDTLQDNGSDLLPTQPYGALVKIKPDAPGSQPALVRMLNAGVDNHPFHPHGNHLTEIAQDGRTVAPTEHFGETIGSGQTEDFLLGWDDVDEWNPVSNPLPVGQPNYRNLTFKDGNTFYSGNPYLGYTGTLPTGTVSQNICGEWYFPWHSHALNEFSNFDEGFGGMATLLRVDPPGGCFAFPTATTILPSGGSFNNGTLANLTVDDPTRTDTAAIDTHIVVDPAITAGDLGRSVVISGTGLTTQRTITAVNPGVSFTVSGGGATAAGARSASIIRSDTVGVTAGSNVATDPSITAADQGRSVTFSPSSQGLGGTRTITAVTPGVSFTFSGTAKGNGGSATRTANIVLRVDPNVGISNSLARVVDASAVAGDVGSAVIGSGIPPGTVINSVSGPTFIMSQPRSTAISSISLQIGPRYYFVNSTGTPVPTHTDWYAQFSGVLLGSTNLVATYDGNNNSTNMTGCCATSLYLFNWTTNSWDLLAGPTTTTGVADFTMNVGPIASPDPYIGTGGNKGLVRVRVRTTRTGTTSFVTGGDFMKLVYDAP